MEWWLYLIDVVDNLSTLAELGTAITLILNLGYYIYRWLEEGDFKINKALISLLFVFSILLVSIPSKETMYSIVAVKIGKEFDNNSEIPEKVLQSVEKYLDDYLKE